MIPFPGVPWFRLGAVLAGALTLFLGVQSVRHAYAERDSLQSQLGTLHESIGLLKRSHAASLDAVSKRAADQVRIVNVTKEITREIPRLIPPGIPDLPGGFRVLHDAAAGGVPVPTGGADEPSVSPQTVAETVADNYSTCLDNQSKLERLQQWLTNSSPKASRP